MVYTKHTRHHKRRSVTAVALVVLGFVIPCPGASPASAVVDDARHVRSTGAALLALLRESADRSATFRALVDPFGRPRWHRRRTHDHLFALMAHELRRGREVLYHSDVVDLVTMEAMFRKIGVPLLGRLSGYETSAARATGHTVLPEISAMHAAPWQDVSATLIATAIAAAVRAPGPSGPGGLFATLFIAASQKARKPPMSG